MNKPLTSEEKKEILSRIYALEYSDEEADFIMKCIYFQDERIKREAENTITLGVQQYIQRRSTQLIQKKGVGNQLTHQDLEDIQADGFAAFAGNFRKYIPNSGAKLTTFLTMWLDKAMNNSIDNIINHTDMTESEHRVSEFLGVARPILHNRGIDEPSAQDFYQLALEMGRDTNKYLTISGIEKHLNSVKGYQGKSVEELNENGFLVHDNFDVLELIIEKEGHNNVLENINKLGFFDKLAIMCKVEAYELSKNDPQKKQDARTIYFNAYKIFKEKANLSKISQRDFTRLLTDATNELAARLNKKSSKRKHSTFVNNSLILDDSFDTLFGEEVIIDADKINITLDVEFNKKYSK